jgi:hypothetical protein
LPCLALTALGSGPVAAQSLTPDLFNPNRGGFASPDMLPTRRTAGVPQSPSDALPKLPDPNAGPRQQTPASSRVGQVPTYGLPAANGASGSGYDSLNRKRQQPKLYPGQPKPKRPAGPGSPTPPAGPAATLTPPRIAPPPSETAHKVPVPPAMAGNVPGQPLRRRLKLDEDPFGAVGDYAGSFLVKGAVEVIGGYDSNPARFPVPKGSGFYTVAPELMVTSDWSRHALVADLRGSFTGYGSTFPPETGVVNFAPVNIDRPDFTGRIDGRLDVTHDTSLTGELRLRVGADNPGSPNIQAGLAKFPLYATTGGTLGFYQNFNRLNISGGATFDRTAYQDSLLTNGVSTTNIDRNFNQYGGVLRTSYEILPFLKPFAEVGGDTRIHDQNADRSGYQRDSNSGYGKVGSTFEFTRLITGEASIGYGVRLYQDPRLANLTGLLTSGSLAWAMTPLTTVKLIANSSLDETTLPGASGVVVRTYTAQVDHDFRRWLTATGRFTYGTLDYQGGNRLDQLYSIGGDLVWKLNRSIWVKAQVRRDVLNSSLPGASSSGNVFLLGVRLQN